MERMKLKVTTVNDRMPYGTAGKDLKKFTAVISQTTGGDGTSEHQFTVFDKDLDQYIKSEHVFEADVDVTEKGDFTNRVVQQIYIDGKPVKEKKGFTPKGKSPEERTSIEEQVAFKGVIELRLADKLTDTSDLYLRATRWANKRLP